MATSEEMVALARRFVSHEVAPDMCAEWADWTPQERRETISLTVYIIRTEDREPAERKARALFRSWLTAAQRAELTRTGQVVVTGSAGGRYRIGPTWLATTRRIERHGRRDFAVAQYCLHDAGAELPRADIALAHLLLIVTDEAEFLRQANEHARPPRKRLNAARRNRSKPVNDGEPLSLVSGRG